MLTKLDLHRHHYRFHVIFSHAGTSWTGSQIHLSCANSSSKPCNFQSCFTNSSQVFLRLPFASAAKFPLRADTLSSLLLRSMWPNHVNHPLLTVSVMPTIHNHSLLASQDFDSLPERYKQFDILHSCLLEVWLFARFIKTNHCVL